MYDIHCHLIPGVDDGADNLSETIEMCLLAVKGGTRGIAATPHCNIPKLFSNYWNDTFNDKIREIRKELARRDIPLKIFTGQEIFLTGDVVGMLRRKELITINNSRYVLVELDPGEAASTAYQKLENLRAGGYVPIVAHPERYGFFTRHRDAEEMIKSMGCLLQLNKSSLRGSYGPAARTVALRLLDERMADIVASDSHGPYERTPYMDDAFAAIADVTSYRYAEYLFETNPGRVLRDEDILPYR
ncbi:MAG: hypothetical protein HUJ76_06910 [Parasporobacterium sp.]|nr:hypothetical protein [Parasporobacterium sp.]